MKARRNETTMQQTNQLNVVSQIEELVFNWLVMNITTIAELKQLQNMWVHHFMYTEGMFRFTTI